MGVFLDKPKKDKDSESGEGNGLKYAMCAMQGWRMEMEDAHSIKIELTHKLKNCSYFAVFDGHAGNFVSNYSSEHLIETILELWCSKFPNSDADISTLTDQKEIDNFREIVIEGFLKIDSSMRVLPKVSSGEEKSGTTAVASFVTPNKIIFANCGDSRALLCSNNDVKFVTNDHKPYNEEEKKRIENAGGSVMIERVNGSLAVSRALGDYDYKNSPNLSPTEQLVSAEPDLTVVDRSDEDQFLILACDGIWDVMTNQEIVSYIKSRLLVYSDLKKVCEDLLDTCLGKGSRDNMSVILITFAAAPQVSEEAVEREKKLEETIAGHIADIVKESGEDVTLAFVLEMLKSLNLPDLPPGGGIQSKLPLIEQTLNNLLPHAAEYCHTYDPANR